MSLFEPTKPDNESKPEGVTLGTFQMALSPGKVPGSMMIHFYALGSDERMYFYNTAEQIWFLVK